MAEFDFNPDKKGGVVVLVGKRRSGKTPTLKELIAVHTPKNVVVYDPRHEYSENFILFYKFEYFKQFTSTIKCAFIIIEEATSVISFFKDEDLTEWMIACEHNNNMVFFIFHSLMDTPPYISRNTNCHILFETGDDIKKIKNERAEFLPYMTMKKPVYILNNL